MITPNDSIISNVPIISNDATPIIPANANEPEEELCPSCQKDYTEDNIVQCDGTCKSGSLRMREFRSNHGRR
jgi:hypothetical protein